MFIASQVPDADRMQPKRATKPARTDERRLAKRAVQNYTDDPSGPLRPQYHLPRGPDEEQCRPCSAGLGSPRRSRTAKASRISRYAVKSRCAREWGGWGRLSDDGPGHYNPDPSEGPWGRWSIPPHGGA